MKTKTLSLFAVAAPGLEAICAKEMRALGLSEVREVPGGVEFCGELSELYRANLWLRSASRVL
ncbi:MAG: class I SAM-dependent RNA methyltransferase, partial [Desulfuromonadales bacterium]|nr:class I SAM-dependent RNA methyltransferase [Desulfuromonadales bacterium]NIR33397.1 class I SAM-dependent RNA methyltransferase [Desulfuromonadales bacterium]NIS43386.1 class I SAM-dependent RNA methyltransferase [Desulfuromonadales bacterium]